MSYIIFGDTFTFPEGGAATNRVHTYAKGFCENGIKVHVICFENEYLHVADGLINGYYFYHPFGQRKRNKYFIIRSMRKIIKYYKTIILIRAINKKDKVIAINCWTQRMLTTIYIYILAKFIKAFVIIERSEHPLRNYQGSFFRKMQGHIRTYIETKLCDGIFCISNYLIDFYKAKGVNPKRLFLVPSTVEKGRFRTSYDSPLGFQYILYCGSLTIIKDGVNILIESFARISGKHPDINLVLIGKGDSIEEEMIFRDIVNKLDIKNRVFFLGQLSREVVPAYLMNAKINALARPTSIVADAGFPSKLTEYLATGIPVVITEVGEIPVYLKDDENAFLSKPDNIDAFAEKLDYVLNNYDLARVVSSKGQELTDTIFNYNIQAKRMIEFITSLK